MQNEIQQGTVDFEAAAIIVNEAQFSKFVHEETHAGPRRANHLRKRLLLLVAGFSFSGEGRAARGGRVRRNAMLMR